MKPNDENIEFLIKAIMIIDFSDLNNITDPRLKACAMILKEMQERLDHHR